MISALFLAAMIHVESHGDDRAINYKEQAYGCLQIRAGARQDFHTWTGRKVRELDCFDRSLSIEIFTAYMAHYCTETRLGHKPTEVDVARIWDGGPLGFKKLHTLTYWAKVQREMLRLRAAGEDPSGTLPPPPPGLECHGHP